MAKQLGIHQIKGKVGQRSYYRTKGVVDGLSRSINQGLSSRVKTADEYANTRLNNAEFKNANSIATAAFKQVPNRSRGMMVNFAIALMTKKALEDIKQGAGNWGSRHALTELDRLIADMLGNHAKAQSVLDGLITFSRTALNSQGLSTVTMNVSVEAQQVLLGLGIDSFMTVAAQCLAGEIDVDGTPRLYTGSHVSPSQPIVITGESAITIEIEQGFSTPSSVGMSASGYSFAQEDPKHGFYVISTILPMRTVNNKRFVMQEYCTYVCESLGQIPD